MLKKIVTALIAVLMVVILPLYGTGCGSTAATGDITVTSTSVFGHTHQITVLAADLQSPPPEKVIDSTAAGSPSHTHTVTLTLAQYTSINNGQTVTVTSSNTAGHTHDFVIAKTK